MYTAQTNKIDNSLVKLEDAREEYAVWKEEAKRTQMVFEAGSRPLTPNPEGKWQGDEIFKPPYLSESPNPLEFKEWKAKFQKWADFPKSGEKLGHDMERAQQIAHVSVGPFWEGKLAKEKHSVPKDMVNLMKEVEEVVMKLYSLNKRRHNLWTINPDKKKIS